MSSAIVTLAEAAASSTKETTTKKSINDLNADDFLTLMIKELKNQDPSKPTSTSEMLSQMTQMSTITTFEKLNTSFTSLLNLDFIGLSTSMLGKQVSYLNSDGETITGIVDSVKYEDSNVYLVVGEDTISMTDITAVDDAPETSTEETDSTSSDTTTTDGSSNGTSEDTSDVEGS